MEGISRRIELRLKVWKAEDFMCAWCGQEFTALAGLGWEPFDSRSGGRICEDCLAKRSPALYDEAFLEAPWSRLFAGASITLDEENRARICLPEREMDLAAMLDATPGPGAGGAP